MSQDPNLRQTAILANTVGQIGCVTGIVALAIIGVAFGAGWFLDDFLGNERKIFTVIFMLGSSPGKPIEDPRPITSPASRRTTEHP